MKLTAIEATEECRAMWAWLAEHPTYNKGDYLKMEKGLLNYNDWPHSECYFCERAAPPCRNPVCSNCLGKGVLWSHICMEPDNPYDLWGKAQEDASRTAASLEMVAGCDKILERLKKEV